MPEKRRCFEEHSDAAHALKERRIQEVENLPEDQLQEVLEFVGYLLSKERKAQAAKLTADLNPAKDPLLKFIGGVSHGALAKDIDSELYRE